MPLQSIILRPTALILILGILISLPFVSIHQDSSLTRWLPQDSPAMQAFRILKEQYDIHEVMILSKPDSKAGPDREISGARLILSPDSARELVEENANLKLHPFFGPLLYREGNQLAYYEIEDPARLPDFSELRLSPDEGIFSETYLNRAMDEVAQKSSAPWFVLFGTISLVILSLSFGSVKTSLGLMLVSGPGILLALALHQKFFGPLYPISLMAPPIIFLLTLTASLHRMAALKANPAAHWRPTILALGTSAAGFFTLTTSSLTPAIALGVMTGTGILFNLLSLMVLLPLIRFQTPASRMRLPFQRSLVELLSRFGKAFALIMSIVFFLSLYQMQKLVFASEPLPMLPSQNSFRIHAETLQNKGGFLPMTLILPLQGTLGTNGLLELERAFVGLPALLGVHGALDWIRLASLNVYERWEIPEDSSDLELLMEGLLEEGSPSHEFLGNDFLRLELQWDPRHRSRIPADLNLLQSRLENLGYRPVLGGLSRIAMDMDREMLQLFSRCFPLSVILIFCALILSGSGLLRALFALIPNLLPITLILAVQAWAEIPVDLAGSIMGAILLGIAVDDTLHILEDFRNHDISWFLQHSLRAVLLTSLVLVLGFGGFFLAPFGPIRQFGFYLSVGAMIAFVSDVFGFAGWLSSQKTSSRVPAEKSIE